MTDQFTGQAGPFHYEDLEGLPDDCYRREIIGGSLIVTPAPNGGHQLASARLTALLLAAQTPRLSRSPHHSTGVIPMGAWSNLTSS